MFVCLLLVALRVHCRVAAWQRTEAGLFRRCQWTVLSSGLPKATGCHVHDNRGDESGGKGTTSASAGKQVRFSLVAYYCFTDLISVVSMLLVQRRVVVPPELGYGKREMGEIPVCLRCNSVFFKKKLASSCIEVIRLIPCLCSLILLLRWI
jgi:hypothetical protein